ncbi:unnamed protein product [Brassica rapa subsp. trilocularis]
MKNVAKCDTWCELQNPVNHRVFERKLHPKPSGRGHSGEASSATDRAREGESPVVPGPVAP